MIEMNRFDPKLTCTYVSEWWRMLTFPTPGYLQSTRIRGLLRIDERFSQFLHGDSGDFDFTKSFGETSKYAAILNRKKRSEIEVCFWGVLGIFFPY